MSDDPTKHLRALLDEERRVYGRRIAPILAELVRYESMRLMAPAVMELSGPAAEQAWAEATRPGAL